MVQITGTIAVLLGGAACASAFTGSVGMSSFGGMRVIESNANTIAPARRTSVVTPRMGGKENAIRQRITTVNNTKKITTAMRLVAAAKVRRAQDAVMKTRPFSETLQSIFGALIAQLGKEDVSLPLLTARDVKNVILVGVSGDRGLCGAYNNYIIKKVEARGKELTDQGYNVEYVTIGKKISQYMRRREQYTIKRSFDCGQLPNAAEASSIAQELLSDYLSGEADSVEIVYTRFVSLIASEPSIRTLLPLSIRGIEDQEDELFQLTSENGKFKVEREDAPEVENADLPQDLIFEQDPIQILNSILPLYLDGQILRMLQESVAAELAARMASMAAASDNAADLSKRLSLQYNRARQASVTQELLEIVAGADAAGAGK